MFDFVPVGPDNWDWIYSELLLSWSNQTTGVVAVKDDDPAAACIMDNWTENGCNIHIIITNPMVLRHGFLEEAFDYIFNVRDKRMVWGFTPSNNEAALKFIEHAGMQEQFRMENASSDGVDFVVTRMLKEDCRWLQKQLAA